MKNGEYLKMLEKIQKTLYVLIVLVIIGLIIGIVNSSNISKIDTKSSGTEEEETVTEYDVSEFNKVDYAGLVEAVDNKDYTVIYFGRETCGYCVQFVPIMKQAQEDYGFTTVYVDITEVTEEEYNYLVSLGDFFSENYGTTPMVAVFKNGEYVNGTVGYTEYDSYASFLELSGITK